MFFIIAYKWSFISRKWKKYIHNINLKQYSYSFSLSNGKYYTKLSFRMFTVKYHWLLKNYKTVCLFLQISDAMQKWWHLTPFKDQLCLPDTEVSERLSRQMFMDIHKRWNRKIWGNETGNTKTKAFKTYFPSLKNYNFKNQI